MRVSIRYVAVALATTACGGRIDASSAADAGGTDTAIEASDASEAGDGATVQSGEIIFGQQYSTGSATIRSGTMQTTTDPNGYYALDVPLFQPFTMTVTAPTYVTLDEQEWLVSGDVDRGTTNIMSTTTFDTIKAQLVPPSDDALGMLQVVVKRSGSCASTTGTTLGVPDSSADGGGAQVAYFSFGYPSTSTTSVIDGQVPSAIIYDLPLGVFSNITVTAPPGCTLESFPVVDSTLTRLTYTGKVKLEASAATISFMRVFLH